MLPLIQFNCFIINVESGWSYISSPDWIKKMKATINPKNTEDKCFQYAVTVALNYGESKWNRERISNIRPFINKYNGKGINYP